MKPATPPGVPRTAVLALVVAVVVAAWAALAGTAVARPQVAQVREQDFRITAPRSLSAGSVVLQVSNAGPDTHELILARSLGAPLPLRPDNLTVDEQRLLPRTIGSEEDVRPGSHRTWRLVLAPGRYVLFCNMSGHYLAGMHRLLVVR